MEQNYYNSYFNDKLLEAAQERNLEKIEEAIQDGADVNAITDNKKSVVCILSDHSNQYFAVWFIQKYNPVIGNFDTGYSTDYTALHHAAHFGHEELARLLVERGAKVNIREPSPWKLTPLAVAEGCSFPGGRKVAELLRKHGGTM